MRGFWRQLWRKPTPNPSPGRWLLLLLGGYFLLTPLVLGDTDLDRWSSATVGFGIIVAVSTDFLPAYQWKVGGVLRVIGMLCMLLGLLMTVAVIWQILARL